MEQLLTRLFDYQKFQENARITALIRDTQSRYGEELDDADLLSVSAAGEAGPSTHRSDKEETDDPYT